MNYLDDLLKTLPEKRINSWWLYDARGSELFEAITELDEYYPTRTEMALLRDNARAIADFIGAEASLVEYGAGALTKVRILLDAMERPARYLPVDVSGEFVGAAAAELARDYPALEVTPIVASFLDPFDLSGLRNGVGFFPGSTIGNLRDEEIVSLLGHARTLERFVLGVDLAKDPEVMVAAYDDAKGVTARFGLNLLVRANREVGADFDLEHWRHVAEWNADKSRMELYVESQRAQTVRVGVTAFAFGKGERVLTEISRKFTPEILGPLLADAGWGLKESWVDEAMPFAVLGLS